MNKYIYIIGVLLSTWTLPMFSQVSNDNEDRVNKIDSRWAKNDYVPGQVLVKFKDSNHVTIRRAQGRFASTSVDKLTAVLQKYGTDEMEQLLPNENPNRKLRRSRAYNGDIIQERDLSQLYFLKLSAEHQHETMQVIEELNILDEVEYAEPNYRVYIMGGTIADNYGTNPMVSKQWYLDAYGVTELWDKPIINSERPVIAIIDTGVDTEHPDLKDNCIAGYDFVNNTDQVIDDNMHGTHVAGIAAACHNEIGIVGANPRALIMPVKVLPKGGAGNLATVLKGVAYAVDHGAKILNLSLGNYGYSKAAADVYRNASLSAIIVAGAGNDNKCIYASHAGLIKHGNQPGPIFPGAYSFVLGVQATNQKGELASFSNYDDDGPLFSCEASVDEPNGFNYELKAPGTEIYSTLPGGGYGELQGTSMASPLVAGSISALMMVKKYDSQEQLWAELLHTNNIAEAFALTELPADLDVVRIMLRERKEFSDETEEAYTGMNEVKAGEIVNIYPVIRCTSGDAKNIKLKMDFDENEDPNCVQIITGEADFGWHLDAMGKAVSKNPLVIKIPEGISDSRHIRMKIIVSCENQEGTNQRSFTFLANNMETISGILSENTTLYTGHCYYIDDNLAVNKGVTLTIEPGTRLEFADNKKLYAYGKLVAKGTIENPIVFTSHLSNGNWSGIMTRKPSGEQSHRSLYMNTDTTLFTIFPTDATPIDVSRGFIKNPYYNPTNGIAEDKTFELKDYMEDWNENENFVGKESLLTDPNYITPAVLKMLEDFKKYCSQFGSGERSETNTSWVNIHAWPLSWKTYEDYGDSISYCRIYNSDMSLDIGSVSSSEDPFTYPYMRDCVISGGSYREAIEKVQGIRNVLTENQGWVNSWESKPRQKYWNIINNSHEVSESKSGTHYLPLYSDLKESNYFNNPAILSSRWQDYGKYNEFEYWLQTGAAEPEVDHAKYPSYLGTSREDIVRPHIYELGNAPGATWGTIDLSNMRKEPVREAHGIVWKVLVNGKDAQDEYEDLAPLGVGKHKFEVYFNRPMNKAVTPQISFGVRDPWTQNGVDEDASWNEDGTIYTAYKTITGKTSSDGINRIYVRGAEDDEFFPCPYEKTRFNINVQAAGSMATGFAAEASVGRVNLTWNNENNDFEDAMGFNVYRFGEAYKKVLPSGWRDDGRWYNQADTITVRDTLCINQKILDITSESYTDYDVEPGKTYYYYYKVLSTDLKEYDISNVVAATPITATMGDANGSGEVDVADVVATVNYAVGMKPEPFIFDAADMNSDKNIDVLDVIGIVQKVLNPNGASTASLQNHQVVYTVEDGVLYVESPIDLAGIQVQLNLDGRCKKSDIRTTQELNGFEQASAWMTDDDYLLLAYSMNGKTLTAGKHALLYVSDSDISQLRISDVNGHNVKVIAGDGATQIDVMGSRVQRQEGIYDLYGRKLSTLNSSQFSIMKKGVYIINGKKVVK